MSFKDLREFIVKLEKEKGSHMIRIVPNPILVDHVDSYFVLIPKNIFLLAGNRAVTRSRFLEFLLYQAEMKRRQYYTGSVLYCASAVAGE